MLWTKARCRAKCAEHLKANQIKADLFMDRKQGKKYLAWFYNQNEQCYWLVRNFRDAAGKEWIISKPLMEASQKVHNLPIDNMPVMC